MMSGYIARLACVVALVLSMSPPAFAQGNPPAAAPDWVSLPRPAKPDRKHFEAMAELLLAEFKLMRQAGLKTLDEGVFRTGLVMGLEILYQAQRIGANDTAARLGEELEHYVDAAYDQIRSGRLDYPEKNLSALALAASVYRETGDTARATRYAGQMKSLFGTCLKDEEMNEQLEAVAIYYANAESYRAFFTLIDETFRSAADPCKEAAVSGYINARHHHEVVSEFAMLLAMHGLVEPAKEALALLPVRGSKFDPLAFYDRYPVEYKYLTYSNTRMDYYLQSLDAFEKRAEAASEIVFILAERGEPIESMAPFLTIGLGEASREYAKEMRAWASSFTTGNLERSTRLGLDAMAAAMIRIGDVENGWRLVRDGERNYISDSASAMKLQEEKCDATWYVLDNISRHGAAAIYDALVARLAVEDKVCSQRLKWDRYGNGQQVDGTVRAGMAVVSALSTMNSAELAESVESYLSFYDIEATDLPRIRTLSLNTFNCRQSLMRAQPSACIWNSSSPTYRLEERAILLGWAAHYWAGSPQQITGTIFGGMFSRGMRRAAAVTLFYTYSY